VTERRREEMGLLFFWYGGSVVDGDIPGLPRKDGALENKFCGRA
jgi:hypothetical protein